MQQKLERKSQFAKEVKLTSFKTDTVKKYIDKSKPVPDYFDNLASKASEIDIDKLKTVPVDLKKSK